MVYISSFTITTLTVMSLVGLTVYGLTSSRGSKYKRYKTINLNSKIRNFNQKQRDLGAKEDTWKH